MRLQKDFYTRDILEVAPDLLGKVLARRFEDGTEFRDVITEIEVYRGEEDLASHASKGKTNRTEVMFDKGGFVYVFLIYGMYWLLNFVTGPKGHPQAVLIRSLKTVNGPGRIGKTLKLDGSFYREDLVDSSRLWVERNPDLNDRTRLDFVQKKRVGVDSAGEWAEKPWRFLLQ
jgi:DNA-3-methyladenine glycosylase